MHKCNCKNQTLFYILQSYQEVLRDDWICCGFCGMYIHGTCTSKHCSALIAKRKVNSSKQSSRKELIITQSYQQGQELGSNTNNFVVHNMICAKFLVNQILLWRKFYWRLNPECRLNFPVNGNASHCSGDGAWPGITDEAPQCSEPPGTGSYKQKHERAIPGNNVQPSLNNNAVTKDSPEFRKEVFSISKPNRDSQISGGQIRPQQVQVKLTWNVKYRILESSLILSFVTVKKGLSVLLPLLLTMLRIVHCLAL